MPDLDRALGALLGSAIGDALGAPLERLSHQNVRLYYRGVRTYAADEKRGDVAAGQGTGRTARLLALAEALAADRPPALGAVVLPRPLPGPDEPAAAAAALAAPLGLRWAAAGWSLAEGVAAVREALASGHRHPDALAAAAGQAFAVRALLARDAEALDGAAFLRAVTDATAEAEALLGASSRCSERLRALAPHLDEFPLDLQDRCDGSTGAADAAWPFALAMVARNPTLPEATLLAAVNVGGDAPTVGACAGALLGALNGADAFPEPWLEGVRHREPLAATLAQQREGAASWWRSTTAS